MIHHINDVPAHRLHLTLTTICNPPLAASANGDDKQQQTTLTATPTAAAGAEDNNDNDNDNDNDTSVWKSGPVRSLTPRALDRNCNQSFYFQIPKKTGPNQSGPTSVFCGYKTDLDWEYIFYNTLNI